MLEFSTTQIIQMILAAFGIFTLLAFIVFLFGSLYLTQQVQAASDLLSATGGYMKTPAQQRQWWNLTHNSMIRITEAHFVGITANDAKLGITTGKIDRGMPAKDGSTKITIFAPPGESGTDGHSDGQYVIGHHDADPFTTLQAKAKATAGGVALNGATGVKVNPKALTDPVIGQHGYMMVPAHYGTSIVFTVSSRIPLTFFGNEQRKTKTKVDDAGLINTKFVAQTTSLRGFDQLYSDKAQKSQAVAEADAEARGKYLLELAAGRHDNSSQFGFGTIGGQLDDASASAYKASADSILSDYVDRLQNAKDPAAIHQLTREGLRALNGILQKPFLNSDSSQTESFKTTTGSPNVQLVFRGTTTFGADTLPKDYRTWPKETGGD